MKKQRVFVTGIGPISAVGIGHEEFQNGLDEGRDGRISAEFCMDRKIAVCQDFMLEDFAVSEKTYIDRCSALTLAACALTLEDSGIELAQQDLTRYGLSLGTAWGCLESLATVTERVQNKGARLAPPLVFMHSFINSPASLAAIEFGIKGPASTFSAGDLSSANALQYALDVLRDNRCDLILAGGVEALSETLLRGYGAELFADENRTPGEGACLLTLETEHSATARGAKPLAELVAVTLAGTAESALQQACEEAGLNVVPDVLPTQEIYGHTFGASGALDLTVAVLKIQSQAQKCVAVMSTGTCGRCSVMMVKAI